MGTTTLAEGLTGVVVVARMGSGRLPGKHLLQAGGRTMIAWLCDRMAHEFRMEIEAGTVKLLIATSEATGNEVFEDAVQGLPVTVFRGSDAHIPLRQLQCAQAIGLTHLISVDGDDVLSSNRGARLVLNALHSETEVDLIHTMGLPLGMNVSGYSTDYLQRSVEAAQGQRFTTGWGRVFRSPRARSIELGDHKPDGPIRVTLDYEEDALVFRAILDHFGTDILSASDDMIIEHIVHYDLHRINSHLQQPYFDSFVKERDQEINERP